MKTRPPLRRLFQKTEYAVAYRLSDADILDNKKQPFFVIPASDKFWYADPFPYKYENQYYVFCEVFKKGEGYAGIGYFTVDGGLSDDTPKMIIDDGTHMSFPCIFEENGNIFMVPENCAAGSATVYACSSFPEKWEKQYAVLNGGHYDTAVFEYGKKKYLFTSLPTGDLYGSKLYFSELLYTDDRLCPEKLVEVTEDYTESRMAGNVFMHDGRLIRPAQDCSGKEYGKALIFKQIDRLPPQPYAESYYEKITPRDINLIGKNNGWELAGIHTYGRSGSLDVIDLKICTFSLKHSFLKFRIVIKEIYKKIK